MTGKGVRGITLFFTALFMSFLGGFPIPAQAATDSLQNLYKAAKGEGKVVYWGPRDPEELAPLFQAFKKKFPGIEVEHFGIRAEDFTSRVLAEAGQGRVSLDAGDGKMAVLLPLLERDLIQSHRDWQAIFKDLRGELITENGRFLAWYSMIYPLAYNTKSVKPEEVPKTWEDLLDARWKGKLLLEVRGDAFAYIGVKWGEERVISFMKKLKEQKPIFVRGGTSTLQQLSSGVAPIAVGTYLYKIFQGQKNGAPVDWSKGISPLGASNNSNFVMKGASHPNAAKLLVGFISSEEAIKIQAETVYSGPIYRGSPVPGLEELAKNNVELIMERSDTIKETSRIIRLVGETLGVIK